MVHKVAILIPTINRSDFLIRQLRYYARLKSPHPVYVGDASDEEHKRKLEEAIADLTPQIAVHYYHWPQCTDREGYRNLSHLVEEEFCAFSGDDDFLVADSLTLCSAFLKNHPEYSTAQGKGVLFELENAGAYGDVRSVTAYWRKTGAEERTARERLLNLGRNYWVANFSVHRTKQLREDSDLIGEMPDTGTAEILHNFLVHTKGRSKNLDHLHLLRQAHASRQSSPLVEWHDDAFSWLTSKTWQRSYELFWKRTVAALAEADGISEKAASEIVKQAFWAYLVRCVSLGYRERYENRVAAFIEKPPVALLRRVGFVSMARRLRSVVTARYGELSLPALLRKSSPYSHDFMPIYEAIANRLSSR